MGAASGLRGAADRAAFFGLDKTIRSSVQPPESAADAFVLHGSAHSPDTVWRISRLLTQDHVSGPPPTDSLPATDIRLPLLFGPGGLRSWRGLRCPGLRMFVCSR